MNIVVIINMLGNDDVVLTRHSHMLLCTFAFLVAQTSWGIHTKNILKVPNIFIIVLFLTKVHIISRLSLGILSSLAPLLLCECALITTMPLLLCWHPSFQLYHCYCFCAFITTTLSLLCLSFYNCEHSQCVK